MEDEDDDEMVLPDTQPELETADTPTQFAATRE
jgi:hypothetical protein